MPAILTPTTVARGRSPISEGHGASIRFFPFGRADTGFSVTLHPRLVTVSEVGTIEVSQ